jgi:hypothetical protein
MKNNVGALCVLAILAGSVLSLFAQGRRSQPVDPTAQSPATTAPTTSADVSDIGSQGAVKPGRRQGLYGDDY